MLRFTKSLVAVTGIALTVTLGAPAVAGAAAGNERRPDRQTYVRRADGICRSTMDAADRIVEALGFSPSDAEARRTVRKVVRLADREVRELRALIPPRRHAQDVSEVYDALETAYDRIDQEPRRLFDEPGPFAKPARLAQSYGFRVCGQG